MKTLVWYLAAVLGRLDPSVEIRTQSSFLVFLQILYQAINILVNLLIRSIRRAAAVGQEGILGHIRRVPYAYKALSSNPRSSSTSVISLVP